MARGYCGSRMALYTVQSGVSFLQWLAQIVNPLLISWNYGSKQVQFQTKSVRCISSRPKKGVLDQLHFRSSDFIYLLCLISLCRTFTVEVLSRGFPDICLLQFLTVWSPIPDKIVTLSSPGKISVTITIILAYKYFYT